MSFRKRSVSKKNSRVKAAGESDEEDVTTVVRVADQSKTSNQGFHSSSTVKKNDESSGLGSAVTTVFVSTRELVPQSYAGDATHTTEVDTAHDRDTRAVNDRQAETKSTDIIPLKNGSKGTFGPARAPTFVRVTSRFDYQPDICKDYKETGFCGFGDSCKFLHDRGDYKSGWQLEREWDNEQTKKKKKIADSIAGFGDDEERKPDEGDDDNDDKYAIDSDEEDLPFACFICREDFTNPVVTVCGHYFCAQCAMDGTKNTGNKCPVCNKQTFGVFNRAHKLLKKIATKKGISEPDASEAPSSTAAVTTHRTITAPVSKRGSWEQVDS